MVSSICIVDDHLIFGQGLKAILHSQSPHQVRGVFSSARAFIDFLDTEDAPGLVTVDLMMPEMDGIQLLSFLRRHKPKLKSLVIADTYNRHTFQLCQNMGVNGVIPKVFDSKEVLEAIERVLMGDKYFPNFDWREIRSKELTVYDKLREELELSPREVEVIQLLFNQFETKDIAEQLCLSPHTVKTHRKNIYSKMRVNNLAGVFHYINSQKNSTVY